MANTTSPWSNREHEDTAEGHHEELRQQYLDKYGDKGLTREQLLQHEGNSQHDMSTGAGRLGYVADMNDNLEKQGYFKYPENNRGGGAYPNARPTATPASAGTKSPADLKKAELLPHNSGKPAGAAPASGANTTKDAKDASGGSWKSDFGDGLKEGAKNWAKPKKSKKRLKRGLILGGIGGSVLITVTIIGALMLFLSNFKDVHFAELLRTAGLARFNSSMRQNWSRSITDAATLSDESTGSLTKLAAGVNAGVPKQLTELGKRGEVKWKVDRGGFVDQLKGNQRFGGLEISGKTYSLDAYAREAYGAKYGKANPKKYGANGEKLTYDDLTRSETKKVTKTFMTAVKDPLGDILNQESRLFRYKTYGALRDIAGIKMYKWFNRGQEYKGKSPEAARKLDVEESVANVDDATATPETGVKEVDDSAKDAKVQAVQAAESGSPTAGQVRTKWAQALRTTTKVSTAVFLTTAACIIHSLANSFRDATAQTEKQSLRVGQDAIAAADQIKEGDTTAEAVGADSVTYDNAEKSVMYKQATSEAGLSLTADDVQQLSDIPNIEGPAGEFASVIKDVDGFLTSAVVGGPLIQSILSAVGAGGFAGALTTDGCNVLLNQYAQYSIAGTELLVSIVSAGSTEGVVAGIKAAISGGLQGAIGIGLGEYLGTLIDKAVGSTAGLDYSATVTGAAGFNQKMVGIQEWQSYGNRTIGYGAPVTKAVAAQQQGIAMADVYKQNSQLPFTERYFAASNPYSLTGKLIAYAPSNFSDLADMVRSGLGSVASIFSTPQRMFGTIGNLIMPGRYASAETLTNVDTVDAGGVESWETTQAEQDMQDDGSVGDNGIGYDYASLVKNYTANPDQLTKDTSDFSPCYQQTLQDSIPSQCTPGFLTSSEARQWRFYMTDTEMHDLNTGDLQ